MVKLFTFWDFTLKDKNKKRFTLFQWDSSIDFLFSFTNLGHLKDK